ncbi:MAG: methyltransferase domain-containing protein [Dehalococcoidia bacterium]
MLPSTSLPDITLMIALPPAQWQALNVRLRAIGITRAVAEPITRIAGNLLDPLRAPLRQWRLQQLHGPAAAAMRLLMFQDPVSPAEAREALGNDLFDVLLGAEYIVSTDGGRLVSPFFLNLVNDLFIICDDLRHGGDAVMGCGETTADLCQAGHPTRRLASVLDLGCGAGTAALLYAAQAERAVGVDINPRAVALARINAALNDITNVEFRQGDLFAPVAGETFDLIVSQPPFIARPPGSEGAAYLHGGARGDELPLRVLRELPARLTAGGRAVLLIEWPELAGEPIAERVRGAVQDGVNLLLLQAPGMDLDEHCIVYTFCATPAIDPEFGLAAVARRAHFAELGIERLAFTYVVLERADPVPGWTEVIEIPAETKAKVTSGQLDRLIAARTLRSSGSAALLAASLRIPPGAVFSRERTPGGASASETRITFAAQTLRGPLDLNEGAYMLVALIDDAPTVQAAAERFAADLGAPLAAAIAKILPAVEHALAIGVLEPGG